MTDKRSAPARLAFELLAYNLVLLALLPVIAAWLWWRTAVLRKPLGDWRHRLGLVPRLPLRASPRIWVHAVSAGEMTAARPVVAELRRRFPRAGIALSTHTDTGMSLARANSSGADALFYLPFDRIGAMLLALWRVRPDLVVVVEKELWPNLLGLARLLGAKTLVVSGRVSDRMVRRARWAPGPVRWLYRLADAICLQSEHDADRLKRLGVGPRAPEIRVSGNTKADTLAERDLGAEQRLAEQIGVGPSELWLVAGSTHPREEELVVGAFLSIRAQEPRARLLLCPRHLERVPQVSAMLAERALPVARRSGGRSSAEAVVLLDTMGELRSAYAIATAAFVGGTLVSVGGHNLLEPAAVGVPVLFGPHTYNCADTADLVLDTGVGFRVNGPEQLAQQFLRIASSPQLRAQTAERARLLMVSQRGASARCVAVAAGLLGVGEDW